MALRILAAAMLFCVSVACGWPGAAAQPRVEIEVVFSPAEAELIREFYAREAQSRRPGRRGGLPPGIARNLERGKPLPPGIARQHLPASLEEQLPAREGYERVVLDGRVLLVEIATQVIHDVLTDIFLR